MAMVQVALVYLLVQGFVCTSLLLPSPRRVKNGRRSGLASDHGARLDLVSPTWNLPRNRKNHGRQVLLASNAGEDSNDENAGLNELHTMLRDAVSEQNFVEAGRISDILLFQLYSDVLTNGSVSVAEREEKIRMARRRMSWKGLGAAPWLISRLDSLNYTFPTTIQINSMESVNAILQTHSYDSMEASLEERVGRSNMDMGIVISGTTGSGKSLAYLVPLVSTLSDSLFARQRIRVGAEEMVGDTTGDLLDRLAIVTSPVVRSSARKQIRRSDSAIATGAALSTLGTSGTNVKTPLALIVVPSRELGIQIAMVLYQLVGGNLKDSPTEFAPGKSNMFKYKGPKGVRIGCVLDDEDAAFGLKLQTDVAITMPHYLGKLLEDGDVEASQLRVVVYDEADLALEQTPSGTLKSLFEDSPGPDMPVNEDEASRREYSRLTFLVGASVTEALGNLAVSSRILPSGKSYIATATRFAPLLTEQQGGGEELGGDRTTQASLKDLDLCLYPGLKHYRATVENDEGLLVLTRLLRKELRDCDERNSQGEDRPRVVIFFSSEEEAKAALEPLRDALWGEHRLCVLLPKTGVSPLTILDQFRRNETSVMLATPNSVRGLDVKGLTHVYTLYLPMDDPREYVHLAGRVGRVGQAPSSKNGGNVISILRKNETNQMNELASQLGFEFAEIDAEAIQRPSFVKFDSSISGDSDDDDDDDDVDLVVESNDVESMRRYLEDSMTFLKLADDPTSTATDTSVTNEDDDNEDDDEKDYDGIGLL